MSPSSAKKSNEEAETDELDTFAGKIVSSASHIPRSLFCPFCANEYMFDFTLKDHLKRFHPEELEERLSLVKDLQLDDAAPSNHLCPFCGAIFYLIGLLPKHITNFHGSRYLQNWRHMSGNLLLMYEQKENEPSILYASCSPGLSDIFDKLETNENQPESTDAGDQIIKSILKKTPSKSTRIISSPAGVAIRRSKSELVKRSISVRRELRFDLPPLQKSPNESAVTEKHRKCLNIKKLFQLKRKKAAKTSVKTRVASPKQRRTSCGSDECIDMLTSTPINFLEDSNCETKSLWGRKSPNQAVIRPLLFSSERFQCARCKQRYTSNGDLTSHLKDSHGGVRNLLKPHYQCGQCGVTFFRNWRLKRHCRYQHTPQKVRI